MSEAGNFFSYLFKTGNSHRNDIGTNENVTFGPKVHHLSDPKWIVEYDPKDEGTPDAWVKRHPALVRLSGRHPMNCEPPVPLLMEAGSITPASILVVRSHAACAQCSWADHEVVVEGNCPGRVFKMDEIVSMEPRRTIHATLQCAGNRRKEINMIKQTIGFHWANGGVGASMFTGVPMHEFLRRCGVTEVTEDRRFVWFNGPEGETAKGDDGSFAACLPLALCLDPRKELMICYEMNGEHLTPDHGFPVRLVVPGWVGGRWTKWLKKITIAKDFSPNFFVNFDNKVFPTFVTEDMFWNEGWGYKREYDYMELNLQSTITSPAHDEVISHMANVEKRYTVKGYAYTGGGRPITRVELSLDGGKTWQVAKLPVQQPTEYGNCWAWYLWSCEVSTEELSAATELTCRAWDFALNTQYEWPIWNVMGMANQAYFRVRPRHVSADGGFLYMHFEHPTQPASNKGGWMGHSPGGFKVDNGPQAYDPKNGKPLVGKIAPVLTKAPAQATVAVTPQAKQPESGAPLISLAELQKHDTKEDCWIAIHGKVYNCNSYLGKHPGSDDAITLAAGTDCTDDFEAIHSNKAYQLLEPLYVGDLCTGEMEPNGVVEVGGSRSEPHKDFSPTWPIHKHEAGHPALTTSSSGKPVKMLALDPRKGQEFHLVKKTVIDEATRILKFERNKTEDVEDIPIPVGQRIIIASFIGFHHAMHTYFPLADGPGWIELLVKVCNICEHTGCKQEVEFSKHLDSLEIGGAVSVKGPVGRFLYHGRGNYTVGKKEFYTKKIGMFATHTGIIPLWQVIKEACTNPDDKTEFYLVYRNISIKDCILMDELKDLQGKYPSQCHFTFALDNKPATAQKTDNFKIGKTFPELIQAHFPPVKEGLFESSVILNAPRVDVDEKYVPFLKAQGYDVDRVFML